MDSLGVGRRRLGTGLLAFGLVGVLMAGIVAAALIGGAIAARNLDDRLEADQARIAASLTRLAATMESLAITTQHGGATLQTSSQTLADARDALNVATETSLALAGALNIDILGQQPFAGASTKLVELAGTVKRFEEKAEALAGNLDQNADDAMAMADQIRLMKTQVNELAVRVAGFDRIGEIVGLVLGGIVLAGLLTAWIAVGAAFCAWAGWRLRRASGAGGAGTPQD